MPSTNGNGRRGTTRRPATPTPDRPVQANVAMYTLSVTLAADGTAYCRVGHVDPATKRIITEALTSRVWRSSSRQSIAAILTSAAREWWHMVNGQATID